MNDEERLNEMLQKHYDDMNGVGLAELILFGSGIDRFLENERRVTLLLNHIVKICGYKTNARDFANMISYEDFKKRRGVSEIAALGLKLYLFYACGVDWEHHRTINYSI